VRPAIGIQKRRNTARGGKGVLTKQEHSSRKRREELQVGQRPSFIRSKEGGGKGETIKRTGDQQIEERTLEKNTELNTRLRDTQLECRKIKYKPETTAAERNGRKRARLICTPTEL